MPAILPRLADSRVLVTGGAGFIGSHLVDAIAEHEPAALVVADSFFIGKREHLSDAARRYPKLAVEEVDTSDRNQVDALLAGHDFDIVFDLATLPLPFSLQDPHRTMLDITAMAAHLAEAARLGVIGTLIHYSTSEVYGTALSAVMDEEHPILPRTPYAAAKAGADHLVASYIETFGIEAMMIRPFNNYGPRQNEGGYAALIPLAIRAAAAGRPMTIYGSGEQTRDFIFVGDTVRGTLELLGEPSAMGRAVNLATGRETSVMEVVAAIYDLMGVELAVEHLDARPGDVMRHRGSSELAQKLVGFEASTSLREGLEPTIAWYREHVL